MLGYAVLDCETTGLNRTGSDRIAEIAVATFDLNFNLTGQYETLLNPEQDLGMTSLHGITGLMAANAPRFEEIMPSLANVLHGRIIIGQSVEFDLKFVAHEYAKHGIDLSWKNSYLDTLTLAKKAHLKAANYKLATLCAHFGIPLLNAHNAMADVMATAKLFQKLIRILGKPAVLPEPLRFPTQQLALSGNYTEWMMRTHVEELIRAPYDWRTFRDSLPSSDADISSADAEQYLRTVHLALINDRYSYPEREAMEDIITSLSLSPKQIVELNEEYLSLLLSENLMNDGKVLMSDFSSLKLAMKFTGVKEARVQELLCGTLKNKHLIPENVVTLNRLFSLKKGDGLVLTGEEFSKSRKHLQAELEDAGLAVLSSTTRSKTKAVVCNDPYSLSNKAVAARRFGIPILTESTITKLLQIQ